MRWWSVTRDIEVAGFDYPSAAWSAARRVVTIGRHIGRRINAREKHSRCLPMIQYHYAALVTNLSLPTLEVWRIYRAWANCENRMRELKYDFGAGSFCLREFYATEAALNTVMMAFNLMSLFRRTLKTLRYRLFSVAGYIAHEGGRPILKLALQMKGRTWFKGLWDQSEHPDWRIDFSLIFSP